MTHRVCARCGAPLSPHPVLVRDGLPLCDGCPSDLQSCASPISWEQSFPLA